jgi:hypothetical protein
MICTKKHPLIFKWAVWLYVGYFVNINKLYDMPQLHDYKEGIMVVFMIGLSKYFELILGIIILSF